MRAFSNGEFSKVSRDFDSKGANEGPIVLDLLKSATDGSIVLDLSKVPDQWVFDLLSDIRDSNQPTISPTVADSRPSKVNESKSSRHRTPPVKRVRKRLRVVRKTLKKNVPENRSKLLN